MELKDLRCRDLVARSAAEVDVVADHFRPGTSTTRIEDCDSISESTFRAFDRTETAARIPWFFA